MTGRNNSSRGPHSVDGSYPHFLRVHCRWLFAALVFIALSGLLWGRGLSVALALLLGFDAAASLYLWRTYLLFGRITPEKMRDRAGHYALGRYGVLWSSVALSCVIMVALGIELHAGHSGGLFDMAVAAVSIALSWLYMNTIFATHYAHSYYDSAGREHQGLEFPGKQAPDYWDFAYFALVLGMTFQVSDVQITNHHMRRIALAHSIIAFFFNVFILALSVNIVAGRA